MVDVKDLAVDPQARAACRDRAQPGRPATRSGTIGARCSDSTVTSASSAAPAMRNRSRTRTPCQVLFTLQPSTQAIGSDASCTGSAPRSSSERLSRRRTRPSTTRRYAGSRAAASTCASAAVRLTGNPCGPVSGRRGARSASRFSGATVWPTVNNVSDAAGTEDGQEESPAVERRVGLRRGAAASPIAASQCGTCRRPLRAEVDDQSADRDPGDPVVARAEVEGPGVPEVDVRQAGEQEEQRSADERQQRETLDRVTRRSRTAATGTASGTPSTTWRTAAGSRRCPWRRGLLA